jgi:hypothetical protein
VWSIASWAFWSDDIVVTTESMLSLPWSAEMGLSEGPISYDVTTVAAYACRWCRASAEAIRACRSATRASRRACCSS